MKTTRRGAIERRDLLYSLVVMRLSAVSGRLRNTQFRISPRDGQICGAQREKCGNCGVAGPGVG